LFFVDS